MNTKLNIKKCVAVLMVTTILLTSSAITALASAPTNDNFTDATVIQSMPFSESVDTTDATIQPDEPWACDWIQRTIWYSFTPTTSGLYTASSSGAVPVLTVYTGTEISNLQAIACKKDWNWFEFTKITLLLEAGTTYYFQTYITMNDPFYSQTVTFNLYPTPPPEAYIGYWPGDPSKFDSIQFSNDSYDPVEVGFETCSWDFGDGSSSIECYPIHQFTEDGDYTVQLSVTTFDGRSGSTSRAVQVRTHDVGITRFVVPTSARVGQTRQINVYIKNLYNPETVQVDLYKSTLNGYEWVGSLVQAVPIRPANRAQVFAFTYTYTSQDADMGKVIFRANATVINVRDVYPADNEMFSLATKVTR